MTRSRSLGLLLILGVAAMLAAPWGMAHEGHEPLPTKGAVVDSQRGTIALAIDSARLLDVRTAEVKEFELVDHGYAFVTLESPWPQNAFASSWVAGRITAIHVRSGERVMRGQTLAEIDSRDAERLHLEYQQAQRDLDSARKVRDLLMRSARAGAVPELQLIEAENAERQANNALWVLGAKASLLGLDWSQQPATVSASSPSHELHADCVLPIVSPIDGVVLQQDAVVGQFVEPNTHLFRIVDNRRVWARLHLLEKDLGRVQPGRRVQLSLNAYPHQLWSTTIDRVSLGIDPVTQQIAAWCELDNSIEGQELRPGMTGQAVFEGSEPRRKLAVPRSAVWSDGISQYVFVETASTRQGSEYEKRMVWVNGQRSARSRPTPEQPADEDYVELAAGGLFSSDRLVVQGAHELAGLLVRQSLVLSPEMAERFGIAFESVSLKSVDRILPLDAVVELPPMRRTSLAPQMRGNLQRIAVDRSQRVRSGEVIAEIASLEVVDLELELVRARLDEEWLTDTLARLSRAGGTISPRTLLDLQTDQQQAQLKIDSTRRQLQLLGFDDRMLEEVLERQKLYDAYPLRSACDGSVIQFLGTLGGSVQAGQELFEIHDRSQFQVRGYVPAKFVGQVAVDQTARVRLTAYPDQFLSAKVGRISPVVDSLSGIQSLWMDLQPFEGLELRDRLLARAALVLGTTEPQLTVPRSAVIHDGSQTYVFVRRDDGNMERRRVFLESGDDRSWIVTSGLTLGEPIAVTQVAELQTAYASVR